MTDTTDGAATAKPSGRSIGETVYSLVNSPRRVILLMLAIWVVCSVSYAVLEDDPVAGQSASVADGFWWGVVTSTTVGYGDQYPVTAAGRVLGGILALSAIVLIPIAIGHLIAKFVLDRNQFTHEEQVALATTIEAMYDRVEMLERLVLASMAKDHGDEWLTEHLQLLSELEASDKDIADQMLALFHDTER